MVRTVPMARMPLAWILCAAMAAVLILVKGLRDEWHLLKRSIPVKFVASG
jgi:hypothetical protein